MTSSELLTFVNALLNGRQPPKYYWNGEASERLAQALSTRINGGVAPSLCAHAMCCSSAAGIVAVVKMLASREMSTFNKAYTFGEPLRRSCRAYVRAKDPNHQESLAECAKILVKAHGSLDQPDKYLKSRFSAARSLEDTGTPQALALLKILRSIEFDHSNNSNHISSTSCIQIKKKNYKKETDETKTAELLTTAKRKKRKIAQIS